MLDVHQGHCQIKC